MRPKLTLTREIGGEIVDEQLTFPDTPRSELERTIEELVDRAQRVLVTQERLRSLLRANRVVVEELELAEVLRRIAEAAVELVDAQYGALGVIDPDGGLEQFIHVGMPDETATAIGHLPEGHGLLGAVIETGAPIRLAHLHDDPRSAGFPRHHPEMDAFLGVPIRVRDEVFGNLYLTNPRRGVFTSEDEELISVLAATAGIAIENARLFEDARRRERWSAAVARVTSDILSGETDSLAAIAGEIAQLVRADLVCIVVPAPDDQLRIAAAEGNDAEGLRGREYPAAGTLVLAAITSNEPVLSDGPGMATFDWQPETGPTLVTPLATSDGTVGALTVSRAPGAARFSAADLETASEFAAQASVAMEIAQGRRDRQRLELSEDRARIARDLHDHVIQRLFGAGLSLQSAAALTTEPARSTIVEQVDAIDAAIAEIRTVVFALSAAPRGSETTVRHRLLDLVNELDSTLGAAARLSFAGPVDLLVRDLLADEVVAVVRESLTNVARHAQASTCQIEIAVDDRVRIQVDDDGVGYQPGGRASGTANLAERAARRGGEFLIAERDEGGTRVLWTVPLEGGSA